MNIRFYLKKARENKQFRYKDIADSLGLKERQYQYIESGTKGTSEKNWLELYRLFDYKVPIHKLMENLSLNEILNNYTTKELIDKEKTINN